MSYLAALNYKYKQGESEGTLFVFDTNYFLYAYQSYSNGDSYIKALENKKNDIYVPFITYIEFLDNINSVISTLKSDIKILENYIDSVVDKVEIFDIPVIKKKLKSESFRIKTNDYSQLNDLLKRDIEEIINEYVESSIMGVKDKFIEIEKIFNRKLKEFSDSEKNLPEIAEYEKKIEDLTERIDKLLKNTGVLGEMYTQEEIDDYISDMDYRYAKNIPPGFGDESKEGKEKVFGDLVIPNKAGDLILWKDLINLFQVDNEKKEKFSKVVIVTDDGMSKEKSDWRIKLGKEKVVHDHLKIEFYKKTGKLLDLMKVEDFIEDFSQEDEITKENIAKEIKTFKEVFPSKEEYIVFTLFNDVYIFNSQKGMMEKIFITVINLKGLEYKDLRDLPCISTKHEELNSTFDSYTEIFLDEENEILLGTRLNKTDKLRYIYKLFKIAGIDSRNLMFDSKELQKIWQSFSESKEKLLPFNEIIVSLERPENLLGISVIADVKFLKSEEEIENNLTNQIRDKLINREFHDESRKSKEIEFKDIMQDLGYNIESCFVIFEDF